MKSMSKQNGLAACVNSYTPDILAFMETWLNSGIINNPIVLNNTSYKGEKEEIDLEEGCWAAWGHFRTCPDVSCGNIDLCDLSGVY